MSPTCDRRVALKSALAASTVLASIELIQHATRGATAVAATASPALAEEATNCVRVGEACAAHCVAQLSTGNKDMGRCLASVRDTIAICHALVTFAQAGSPHLKALAAAAADVCADCTKVCEPHKAMAECKACLEACLACEKACRAVA